MAVLFVVFDGHFLETAPLAHFFYIPEKSRLRGDHVSLVFRHVHRLGPGKVPQTFNRLIFHISSVRPLYRLFPLLSAVTTTWYHERLAEGWLPFKSLVRLRRLKLGVSSLFKVSLCFPKH